MKSKIALAVVKRKNPSIDLLQIYSPKDRKDLMVGKDEMIIEVVIRENRP